MSWVYVPALADSSSALNSPLEGQEVSLTWRGKPLRRRILLREWKAGNFITRLSGLIFPRSTLNRGVAEFIASLPVIPASQTLLQEGEKDLRTNGSLSTRFCASLVSAGRIVSSVKTSQGMLTDSSQHSSHHWKQWATALRQEYSARAKLVQATDVSDCSSWPTGSAGDVMAGGSQNPQKRKAGGHQVKLKDAAERWPTPASRDHKGANSLDHVTTSGTGRMHMGQLPNYVEHHFLSSRPVLTMRDGGIFSLTRLFLIRLYQMWMRPELPSFRKKRTWLTRVMRRKLNPYFAEWLMGWPIGWTAFVPLETEFAHWLQRGRISLLMLYSPPTVIEPVQAGLFDE